MKIQIIREAGSAEALLGLSLSYGKPVSATLVDTAFRLSKKDGGHNKFLESIIVWMDITAPRYWWQQFDTYRIGVTKQSESTMHTLLKKHLTQENFERQIPPNTLDYLNLLIEHKKFDELKNILPEGFLQRRIVCLNYKALRNIIIQRMTHKLSEWQQFITTVLAQAEYPYLLPGVKNE